MNDKKDTVFILTWFALITTVMSVFGVVSLTMLPIVFKIIGGICFAVGWFLFGFVIGYFIFLAGRFNDET